MIELPPMDPDRETRAQAFFERLRAWDRAHGIFPPPTNARMNQMREADVLEMRRMRLEDRLSYRAIAQRYGLFERQVYLTVTGVAFKHLPGASRVLFKIDHPSRRFTDEQEREIALRVRNGEDRNELARTFGVSYSLINKVAQRALRREAA